MPSGLKLAKDPSLILERWKAATHFAGEAKSVGRAAVVAALETGAMLERVANALPPRKFEPWIRQTFGTAMSVSTAHRLKRLSVSRVTPIDSQVSLTEAYRIAGILPDRAEKEPVEDTGLVNVGKVVTERWGDLFKGVTKLEQAAPIEDMEEAELEALRVRLEPIMGVLRKVVGV